MVGLPGNAEKKGAAQTGHVSLRLCRIWLIVAFIVLCGAGLFLARGSLAAMAVRQFCRSHELTCELTVSDVSLSGGQATGIRIMADGRQLAAAESVAFVLNWKSPTRVALSEVRINSVDAIWDLTGSTPLPEAFSRSKFGSQFGSQREGGAVSGWPSVNVSKAQLIVRTEAGDLMVRGDGEASREGVLSARISADPTHLELNGYRLDLAQLKGDIRYAAQSVEGGAVLRLNAYSGAGVQCEDINVSVSLDQSAGNQFAGPVHVIADLSAGKMTSQGRQADNLSIGLKAALHEAPSALTMEALSVESLLAALSRLELHASVDGGSFEGVDWARGQADLVVSQVPEKGGVSGDTRVMAWGVSSEYASAESVRHVSRIQASPPEEEGVFRMESVGDVRVLGARANAAFMEEAGRFIYGLFPSPIAPHGRKLSADLVGAANDLDMDAPIAFNMRGAKVLDVRSAGPVEAKSRDDVVFRLRPANDAPTLYYAPDSGNVDVLGRLELRADKASLIAEDLDIRRQSGVWTGAAGLTLDMGRIDGRTLAGRIARADIRREGKDTQARLQGAEIVFSGRAYGASWNGLKLTGDVSGEWSDLAWRMHAPRGIGIRANGAGFGGVRAGAFRTHISTQGPLAQSGSRGIYGAAQIAPLSLALRAKGRVIDVASSAIDLSWRKADNLTFAAEVPAIRAAFDAAGKRMRFQAPNAVLSGATDGGLRMRGHIENGSGDLGYFELETIAGEFLLGISGGGLTLKGHDVSARLRDSVSPARFVAMDYAGDLEISDGRLTGAGMLTHPLYGDDLGDLSLEHDLKSGVGRIALGPTQLNFDPRGLQPAAILPGMRGVAANVSGAVTVTGGAQWGQAGGFQTMGALELTDVGFVTAKAGLFEGVFGSVELTDVLALESPPAQTFIMHNWNPGIPLENGELAFQLTGGGNVILERASWPFASGEIVSERMQWSTQAASNTVVVEARGLDLSQLVRDLGVPDIEASGRLNGRFPVEFVTGAARVRNAVLEAETPGGIIQYDATGLGGAQGRDENVNLLINAVKDFHYTLLRLGVDGEVGGEMKLSLSLLGHNPAVLEGYPFDLEVSVTADLMSLLSSKSAGEREIEAIVSAITDAGR